MTPIALLDRLAALGIRVEAEGDRLHIDAPRGVVTPALKAELVAAKPALLAALSPNCLHCPGRLSLVDPLTRMWFCRDCRGLYIGDPP
ncbi:MAG: hypothetical protein HY720_01080 [Planctomycetes bacterium]|nr:hypothetical protein [Planctomycetota bacterium]